MGWGGADPVKENTEPHDSQGLLRARHSGVSPTRTVRCVPQPGMQQHGSCPIAGEEASADAVVTGQGVSRLMVA